MEGEGEEIVVEDSQQIEDKIEQLEEQILMEPPVEPKRRKKRTMTPEMLKKLEQARIKSVEVKKKNAEMNNKAKLLKKESDKLKIQLLHKTEKELQELKEKLNKPSDEFASSQRIEEFASASPIKETPELIEKPPTEDVKLKEEFASAAPKRTEELLPTNEESSSSDEEIVIKKKKNSLRLRPSVPKKRKPKKIIIESDSETESESEILQLTQKQLKKLLLKEPLPKQNASKNVSENASLEDLYKRPSNYLNNESIQGLSGKKVIHRRNGNTDAFEVARVKIQPTVIDMKPKSVMKRGIDYGIKDDDPAYKNLFGRGLYEAGVL